MINVNAIVNTAHIFLLVGRMYAQIVESTKMVIAEKDEELACDEFLRSKRKADKNSLSEEEAAKLARNAAKVAKIRATVHRALWKSMRSSSYPYYMLFLLAILPPKSSSKWPAEEREEHEKRCADLADFSLQDREEGAAILQRRPVLAECLRGLNRRQVRELVISAGTYISSESYQLAVHP